MTYWLKRHPLDRSIELLTKDGGRDILLGGLEHSESSQFLGIVDIWRLRRLRVLFVG